MISPDWVMVLKIFTACFTGLIGIYAIFGDFVKKNGRGLKTNGIISLALIFASVITSLIIEFYEAKEQAVKEAKTAQNWEKISKQMNQSIVNQTNVVSGQTDVLKEQARLIDRIQMNMFPLKPITVQIKINFGKFPDKMENYKIKWDEFLTDELGKGYVYDDPNFPLNNNSSTLDVIEYQRVKTNISNVKLVYNQYVSEGDVPEFFSHLEVSNGAELLKDIKTGRHFIHDSATEKLKHYKKLNHEYKLYIADYTGDISKESFGEKVPELIKNSGLVYKFSNNSKINSRNNSYIFEYYPYDKNLEIRASYSGLTPKTNQGSIVSMFDLIGKVAIIETPFTEKMRYYSTSILFNDSNRRMDISSFGNKPFYVDLYNKHNSDEEDRIFFAGRISGKDMGLKAFNDELK